MREEIYLWLYVMSGQEISQQPAIPKSAALKMDKEMTIEIFGESNWLVANKMLITQIINFSRSQLMDNSWLREWQIPLIKIPRIIKMIENINMSTLRNTTNLQPNTR